MRDLALSAGLLAMALGAGPAFAAPAAYDIAFVSDFADACVPGRLSFEATKSTAMAAGWTAVGRDAHPELDQLMAISEREAAAPDLIKPFFEFAAYAKPIEGMDHYLVVSRSGATLEAGGEPWVYIGCYLYNFEAVAPIDPEPVTALIGKEISNSRSDMHMNAWVWGPPCLMPRTGDTYLTFIPEVSQHKDQTGFAGLVLKFDTSEPDPGEVIPATFC